MISKAPFSSLTTVQLFFSTLTIVLLTLSAPSTVRGAEQPLLEGTEWNDVSISGADQTNVTRVLMVGDSITAGYFYEATTHLPSNVKCAKFATSLYLGNPDFEAELAILLNRYKFNVIHINNGLHGHAYTEQDYASRLPKLLAFLKKKHPEAKIIWAMTTPVRVSNNIEKIDEQSTQRVLERNRIAAEVMKKQGIPVDDLYTLVKDHPEYFNSDGVHYNDKGRAAQGVQVAASIREQLDAPPKAASGQ